MLHILRFVDLCRLTLHLGTNNNNQLLSFKPVYMCSPLHKIVAYKTLQSNRNI